MNLDRWAHLDDEVLARVADTAEVGRLLPSRQQSHMASCDRCRALLDGHQAARALLLRVNPDAELPQPRRFASLSGQPRLFGPLVDGLVVVAVIVVAVVAGSRLVAVPLAPAGGTPSGATSNSPASVAPSAGAWTVLASGDSAGADWSPGGLWLLVWDEAANGSSTDRHVSLYDADGRLVRTISGVDPGYLTPRSIAVWVDDQSFVVARDGRNYLGSVSGESLTAISAPPLAGGVVSSGHGVLAFATGAILNADSSYSVWTAAGEASAPRPGVPVAWSVDGTEIAVWHWVSGQGPGSTGWLEIIRWATMETIATLHEDLGLPFARFDPTGRYLYDAGYIVDLRKGSATHVSPDRVVNAPVWNDAGQLLFPSEDGSVAIYDAQGIKQGTMSGLGDSAAASANGSILAFWYAQQGQPIQVVKNGVRTSLEVPGPIEPPDPALSPDGSRIVAVCVRSNSFAVLLSRL